MLAALWLVQPDKVERLLANPALSDGGLLPRFLFCHSGCEPQEMEEGPASGVPEGVAEAWTATVNYGDGGGAQPLALSGGSFSLAHSYGAAGTFGVAVTVQDDDGGSGSSAAAVHVLTPQQGIDVLAGMEGVTHPLQVKLDAAKASLDRGNETPALNQLGAFLNQVSALVRSGQMTAAQGAALTAYCNRVIAAINL